jgi:hypothetical protein
MLNKIKSLDAILVVLILLGLRSIIDANVAQAIIVACFGALVAYNKYLKTKEQPDIRAEIMNELEKVQANVTSLSMRASMKTPGAQDATPKRFF